MKIKLSLSLILAFNVCTVFLQAQNLPGSFPYAGFSDFDEHYDNGFLVTGTFTYQTGKSYGLIAKTDINGNIIWRRYIRDVSASMNLLHISLTNDNGFLCSGIWSTNQYSFPLYIKFNACGEIEWSKQIITFVGDYNTDAVQFPDDSYAFMYHDGIAMPEGTGYTMLVNLDPSGNPMEIDTINAFPYTEIGVLGRELILLPDSHLLIPSSPVPIAWPIFIRTDKKAGIDWSISWEGIGESTIYDTDYDGNGTFYTTGARYYAPHDDHGVVYKYRDGMQVWTRPMLEDSMSYAGAICVINDARYAGIVSSYSYQVNNYLNYLAVYDSSGNLLSRRYDPNSISQMIRTSDGKIMAKGSFATAQSPLKILSRFRFLPSQDSLIADSLYLATHSYDYQCPGIISTDTLDITPELITGIKQHTSTPDNKTLVIFPNPSKDKITINLNSIPHADGIIEILDSSGEVITTASVSGNGNPIYELDVSCLPSGIYLIRYRSGKGNIAATRFIRN